MAYDSDLLGFPRGGQLPDPFNDLASQALPRTMPDALRWSQAIAQVDPTFREAMERVASYFITDVIVKAPARTDGTRLSRESQDKFEDFLKKTLLIQTMLRRIALDYLVYGNVFVSVLQPIRRRLSCPNCPGYIYPLKTVHDGAEFDFRWDGASCAFNAKCPRCGRRGAWRRHEDAGGPESDVVVKIWNVHEIDIVEQRVSGRKQFIWKIPDIFRRQVREGRLIDLEDTPWEIIEAVKRGDNFRFAPGMVYHMVEPPLSGFDTAGWGLSKALTNFRQAWHCQMLRRMNEAICHEFLVPFRIISPGGSGSGGAADPLLNMSLGNFRAQMEALIRRHRRDPGRIQVSPVPVQYQIAGGEANQLAPFQLIDQAEDAMLNGSGVFADLYKGTLTLQAAPVGLRLFESRWRALVDQLNQLLDAIVDRVSAMFSWEPVDAKLVRARHADDLNRQMALLQLMMGGQVSQTTALRSLGEDFRVEQDQLIDESEYVSKLQERAGEQQAGRQAMGQMAAMSGSSPFAGGGAGGGGGAAQPPGGGGGAPGQPDPTTAGPQEIEDQAGQIAAQLGTLSPDQRRPQLAQLRQQSPVLHDVVAQKLQSAGGQGRGQGQGQGQGGPPQKAARAIPSLSTIEGLLGRRRVA